MKKQKNKQAVQSVSQVFIFSIPIAWLNQHIPEDTYFRHY